MCHHIPQATYPNPVRAAPLDSYLVLLQVGFTIAADCYQLRGALLPHLFTLAGQHADLGGFLSVALSVGSRLPGVTWHLALWSPDFPPPRNLKSDCPADFSAANIPFYGIIRNQIIPTDYQLTCSCAHHRGSISLNQSPQQNNHQPGIIQYFWQHYHLNSFDPNKPDTGDFF